MNYLLPVIKPEETIDSIVSSIHKKLISVNSKGMVVGVSGGVDSSLTLALCSCAAEKYGYRLKAYTLPSSLNSIRTKDFALQLSEKFRVDVELIEIENAVNGFKDVCSNAFSSRYHKGNLASRIRGVILNTKAAVHNCTVMGTGNYDEDFCIGYYTLFGDGAVHYSPIGMLPKRIVRQLARYFGLHDIADQSPTAELEPGQTDFLDLGYTYDAVEAVIHLYKQISLKKSEGEMILSETAEAISQHPRIETILNIEILDKGKKFKTPLEAIRDIIRRHENSALPKMELIHPQNADARLCYRQNALLIGRFQPLHKGHATLIESLYNLGIAKLFIVIGRDVRKDQARNPYEAEKVKKAVTAYLSRMCLSKYRGMDFEVKIIDDINKPDEYAQYIADSTGLDPSKALVASNNPYVLDCFNDWPQFTMGSEETFDISATRIRELIRGGDETWKELILPETVEFCLDH